MFALIQWRALTLLPPEFSLYVFQPVLWLGLAAAAALAGPPLPRTDPRHLLLALLGGAFQVSLLLLSGLLFGFGPSPYAQSLPALALNFTYLGSHLLALELTRWRLLASPAAGPRTPRDARLLCLASVWLVLWLASLPPGFRAGLIEPGSAFRLTGRVLLPAASESLLATYLACSAGPVPALAYRAILAAFEWASPLLPNPAWPVTAFVGTIAPLLALLAAAGAHSPRRQRSSPLAPRALSLSGGWLTIALVALFLLWFNTGLLGFRPSLISGSSMSPTIHPGDIAITQAIRPEQVQVGDVIRFRLGSSWVLHRVVEVRASSGHPVFLTRGDNNEALDPPVEASQLEGRLILVVPRLGRPAIELSRLLHPQAHDPSA
ncbi:MAG: signal peptidase I [Anaerolineae bacterium]|nr:signal peptidase I [Anaerolineae bacterium]